MNNGPYVIKATNERANTNMTLPFATLVVLPGMETPNNAYSEAVVITIRNTTVKILYCEL